MEFSRASSPQQWAWCHRPPRLVPVALWWVRFGWCDNRTAHPDGGRRGAAEVDGGAPGGLSGRHPHARGYTEAQWPWW